MKMKVKEIASPIEEGTHTGTIKNIEYRSEPFEYADLFIELEGSDRQIKYGCPSSVSTESKLGKLLIALGTPLKAGNEVDLEKELIGKKVRFMTINEPSKKNPSMQFARIIEGSIKPIKA